MTQLLSLLLASFRPVWKKMDLKLYYKRVSPLSIIKWAADANLDYGESIYLYLYITFIKDLNNWYSCLEGLIKYG